MILRINTIWEIRADPKLIFFGIQILNFVLTSSCFVVFNDQGHSLSLGIVFMGKKNHFFPAGCDSLSCTCLDPEKNYRVPQGVSIPRVYKGYVAVLLHRIGQNPINKAKKVGKMDLISWLKSYNATLQQMWLWESTFGTTYHSQPTSIRKLNDQKAVPLLLWHRRQRTWFCGPTSWFNR